MENQKEISNIKKPINNIWAVIGAVVILFNNYLVVSGVNILKEDSLEIGTPLVAVLPFILILILSFFLMFPLFWSRPSRYCLSEKILLTMIFLLVLPISIFVFSVKLIGIGYAVIAYAILVIFLEAIWLFFIALNTKIYTESKILNKKLIFLSGLALFLMTSFVCLIFSCSVSIINR